MGYNLEVSELEYVGARSDKHKMLKTTEINDLVAAQITLDDLTTVPRILKSNALLIANTDELLQAKFDKIRIFKSFWELRNEDTIAKINSLNASQIARLYAERPRIN